MALRVWLPLNGSLENQGISGIVPTMMGSVPLTETGKIGKCAYFSNNPANCVYMDGLQQINNFSWTCWFKCVGEGSAAYQFLLSEGRDCVQYGVNLRLTKEGTGLFAEVGANSAVVRTSTKTIELNKWYHAAMTINSTELKLYVDGELFNTKTLTLVPNYEQSNNKFVIGKMAHGYTGTGSYFPFNGYVNDVRIYDHCLSSKEVKEISQGLVLHYKLNGFSGGSGENLVLNSKTFNGWSIGSGWVKGEEDGYTTYNFSRTGATANNWVRIIPTLKINPNDYPNGITVSMDIKPVDISVINQTCLMSLQIYKADGTRIGWNEPQQGTGGMINNQWTRISYTFNQNALKTISTSGYTTADISYTQFSFQLVQNGNITIRKIKIENGTVATPYSEAQEDLGIDTAKITDSSGYGNDGDIIGELSVESGSSRYTSAIHIGSTSSKIHILNFPTAGFGNSYTFAWWAKVSSVNPMHWGFSDGIRLNGMYTGRLWNTGDGSNNPLYAPGTTTQVTAPTVNVWHHWVMTGDGTSCKVYQDGVYWGVAKTYKSISGTSIYINGWNSGTDYCSDNLSISDFRIYATALSAEDILDLYHTPANVDNLQNIHAFELKDNENTSQILKNGIMATKEFHESNSELLNSFSSGGYAPAKNTNNSCVNMGIADFSNYADLNKDLSIHIECNIEWTAFTADTGGTFRGIWWQGSNYKKETSAYAWEGANYICSILNSTKSLQNVTTVASPGKYHYDVTTTIPASWFNTYSKSNIGFRCDYSDGTGRIDVTNFKITPLQYYDARIGKDFISANNFIEK